MNASQRNIVLKFPELLIKLPNTSHLSLVKTFPAAQIYKLPIFTSIGDRSFLLNQSRGSLLPSLYNYQGGGPYDPGDCKITIYWPVWILNWWEQAQESVWSYPYGKINNLLLLRVWYFCIYEIHVSKESFLQTSSRFSTPSWRVGKRVKKLQCLYENLISNNFRGTAVLKKQNNNNNMDCTLKLQSKGLY